MQGGLQCMRPTCATSTYTPTNQSKHGRPAGNTGTFHTLQPGPDSGPPVSRTTLEAAQPKSTPNSTPGIPVGRVHTPSIIGAGAASPIHATAGC